MEDHRKANSGQFFGPPAVGGFGLRGHIGRGAVHSTRGRELLVQAKRNHHRHVHDLHRGAQFLRDHRSFGTISSQEGHEMDVGQNHGSKLTQVDS